MASDVEVLPTAALAAEAAARRFVLAAGEAIRSRGAFVVALSGGSTPRSLYARLAAEPIGSRVEWSRVQVLWGDERCVPPDDAASNYRMAREMLLDQVRVPEANVHRIRGEDDPPAAALAYEGVLRGVLGTPVGPPRRTAGARIDLVLLGLGDDGHTASLFPGSDTAREETRWVVAARGTARPMWRVTLTPVIINAAAEMLFLVIGGTKAEIVRRVLEGPQDPRVLPAQSIKPTNGRVHWVLDAAAAARLGKEAP
ncbi:MAG TPA: 6-phosphogluconolactonase [Gemmatimonadales bacterium]|nr:6-phosphogluconolactonase [Gemmatimonadales bacterium]